MKMPPFNASDHGDSDDMCFKFIRLLDGELLRINFLIFLPIFLILHFKDLNRTPCLLTLEI